MGESGEKDNTTRGRGSEMTSNYFLAKLDQAKFRGSPPGKCPLCGHDYREVIPGYSNEITNGISQNTNRKNEWESLSKKQKEEVLEYYDIQWTRISYS